MSKFTPFKFDDSVSYPIEEKSFNNRIPKKVKQKTVNNIIAFSKAYSVRSGKFVEKMEFNLN